MTKLKLDTKKLSSLLADLGKNQSWLAAQVGMSRQLVSYHVTHETVWGAEVFAPVFGMRAKDLVK